VSMQAGGCALLALLGACSAQQGAHAHACMRAGCGERARLEDESASAAHLAGSTVRAHNHLGIRPCFGGRVA